MDDIGYLLTQFWRWLYYGNRLNIINVKTFNNRTVFQRLHKVEHYRQVTGLWRLKEKILILEKGLKDVAVERMKYMMKHVLHPEIAEKGYEVYFAGVNYEDKELSEEGSIGFFYHDENDETLSIRYPMDNYYEQCLACDLDPRMKVNRCENIDEGWISMKLKSNEV